MDHPHDPYAALRNPDYRRLLVGAVLSSAGSEMQSMAVGWELYQRTGSASALGMVGLVQFLPVLFLSLAAGHAADQYSRKRLLFVAQMLVGTTSVCLAVLSYFQGPVYLTYVLLLLVGIGRAFSAPTRWALVPQVVSSRDLANAVTWNSSGWQIASMLGPAIGGLVIAASKQAYLVYLIAAAGGLALAFLAVTVRTHPTPRSSEPVSWRSLLAGIHFVRRTKLILAALTLDLFAVLLGGATVLLPVFAQDILHVGPTELGWLRAAPSLGALLMAIAMAHRPPLRHAGRSLLLAVAGFGVATIVFGLSENFWLSILMLSLTGALDNVSVVVRGTLVQVLTPDEMRGRVSAVNAIFIGSSNELGAFESGITAAWFGPIISVVGGGVGTILVVAVVMLKWPEIMRLGPLHRVKEAGPIESQPHPAAEISSAPYG